MSLQFLIPLCYSTGYCMYLLISYQVRCLIQTQQYTTKSSNKMKKKRDPDALYSSPSNNKQSSHDSPASSSSSNNDMVSKKRNKSFGNVTVTALLLCIELLLLFRSMSIRLDNYSILDTIMLNNKMTITCTLILETPYQNHHRFTLNWKLLVVIFITHHHHHHYYHQTISCHHENCYLWKISVTL